jgi:hypothetical protein
MDVSDIDEVRFQGPGKLSVYLPRLQPAEAGAEAEPPSVVYDGVRFNYWLALRDGEMPYLSYKKEFCEAEMEWLRSIAEEVRRAVMQRELDHQPSHPVSAGSLPPDTRCATCDLVAGQQVDFQTWYAKGELFLCSRCAAAAGVDK